MNFTVHHLNETLQPFVESIFHYEAFKPDHSIEQVVPTGHVFILIELDGFERHTYDAESLKPDGSFRRAWVSGMHHHHLAISAHQDAEMVVVQLKAGGARPFLHQDVNVFNNRVVDAKHIWGSQLLSLRDELMSSKQAADKLQLAERWLLSQFDQTMTPPLALLDVIKALQSEPAANLTQVIEHYPHSQKQLIEHFKKYVGLTPKYYQRVLRFNDILVQIQSQQKINWSDVAYQCGFSDQSHFIKEFKHFSGFNPREFITQDLQHRPPNFFPLD